MRDSNWQSARLLGYVQLQVGSRTFALPVQSVQFASGTDSARAGGLFEEKGQLAILVDSEATPADLNAQIVRASEAAIRELSKRYLN
jgi:hypothetical protein